MDVSSATGSTCPAIGAKTADYYVCKHVYVCTVRGSSIFLDLERDRYFALDAVQAGLLDGLVAGWPSMAPEAGVDGRQPEIGVQIGMSLVHDRLLTRDAANGKDATPDTAAAVKSMLIEAGMRRTPRIRLKDIRRFLLAYVRVRLAMRCTSLQEITRRVAARKAKFVPAAAQQLDLERMRQIVGVFDVLRALTFTAQFACLFDSLVLIDYLSQYRIYPMWVMGVRTDPFAAHSWVQHDVFVVNGTVDYVGTFTPIMTV